MWHKIAKYFATVDCVEEMTVGKSCMDGKYGSFENLLCFFVFPSVADFVHAVSAYSWSSLLLLSLGRTFALPLVLSYQFCWASNSSNSSFFYINLFSFFSFTCVSACLFVRLSICMYV